MATDGVIRWTTAGAVIGVAAVAAALVAVAGIHPGALALAAIAVAAGRCACSGDGKPSLIANSLIEGILVGKDLNPISAICGATC